MIRRAAVDAGSVVPLAARPRLPYDARVEWSSAQSRRGAIIEESWRSQHTELRAGW